MTYLEALYGSQYLEISERRGDTTKGRMNGNLFLAVFLTLILVLLFVTMISVAPVVEKNIAISLQDIFGHNNGKTAGRLLVIPLLLIIYFIISVTVGTKGKYQARVSQFMNYPDELKRKANRKILIPFFFLLAILIVLIMLRR